MRRYPGRDAPHGKTHSIISSRFQKLMPNDIGALSLSLSLQTDNLFSAPLPARSSFLFTTKEVVHRPLAGFKRAGWRYLLCATVPLIAALGAADRAQAQIISAADAQVMAVFGVPPWDPIDDTLAPTYWLSNEGTADCIVAALRRGPKTTSHLRRDCVVPFWQNTFLSNGELAEFGL